MALLWRPADKLIRRESNIGDHLSTVTASTFIFYRPKGALRLHGPRFGVLAGAID